MSNFLLANKCILCDTLGLVYCSLLHLTMSGNRESSLANVDTALDNINLQRYLDVDYSKLSLFKRALYVFRLSYFGYESLLDNACYQRKLVEYGDLMGSVFSSDDINLQALLEEVDKNIEENHLVVRIQIAEVKIIRELKNAKVVAYCGIDNNELAELSLFEKGKVQYGNVISFRIRYDKLKMLRVEGRELAVEMHAWKDNGEQYILPNKLRLRYLNIHPEGYRTWFDFDATVQCLVTIRFSVQSAYTNSRLTLTEHTQLILHIFQYRYKEYLESNDYSFNAIQHSSQQNEKRTSSLHCAVNPSSEDAFWPCVKVSVSSSILDQSSESITSQVHSLQNAEFHCHELELAYDENDEPTEEKFCRCSQWCNVSAFYYHNPIFRFLMVQFTNFYVNANASLPSSYMCAISYLFAQESQQQIPIPLLSILSSVLSYMKLSYSKKIQFLAIDACSYKQIRSVDINNLVQVMNSCKPFNAEQVACINRYYQIFMYLHSHIGRMDFFVKNDDIDAWYDLMYEIIYKGYNTYLYASTQAALHAFDDYSLITLFDHFNYSTKWTNFDFDMGQVICQREQLYSPKCNPLNVKFNCHPFLHVIYNISKFIMEIYQPLSSSEKKTQRCQFAIQFDRLLWKELPLLISYENEPMLATLSDATSPSLERYLKKLHMLFTLKQYSFAFIMQQYFTTSLICYNQAACHGYLRHIPASLRFVFSSDWIERTFSQAFPMEHLFSDQCSKFETSFDNFYQTVWPPTKLSLNGENERIVVEILQECCKLCLWWKIDGRNLRPFKRILEIHRKLMSECITRADNLFTHEFAFVDKLPLSGDVNCLLKDQIALNLVQAACFTLAKITYCLIKSVHRLQPDEYTEKKFNLTLARPGIIELVSSLDAVLKSLGQLKTLFQAFNDEFDIIGRSIRVTEYTITNMYRELYVKLAWEWHCQVKYLIEKANSNGSPKILSILHFALILEMHFVVRFHRFFRQDYFDFKHMILKLTRKLRTVNGFDCAKYSQQLEDILSYEINCTGWMPFLLSYPLETGVFEALAINAASQPPFEILKQLGIDVNRLS